MRHRNYYPPVLTEEQRTTAMMLLRAGEATVGELAKELEVSRQALQQLANKSKINVSEARTNYVRKLWKEACK